MRTGVRITRQWKSTLRRAGYDDLCQAPLVSSTASTEYLTSLFCLVWLTNVSNRFFPTYNGNGCYNLAMPACPTWGGAGGRREPSELNDNAVFLLENKRENGYGSD